MAASNALESRIFASSVFRFTRVNQVLELGVDDVENEEQKRLTKSAAWKSSRAHDDGDQGSLGGAPGSSTVEQALQVVALAPCQRT